MRMKKNNDFLSVPDPGDLLRDNLRARLLKDFPQVMKEFSKLKGEAKIRSYAALLKYALPTFGSITVERNTDQTITFIRAEGPPPRQLTDKS